MIQASELRIGNWYNEYGIPKKVTAGFIQSLFRIQSFNKLAIDVSPIPLTPEILEKLPFDSINKYECIIGSLCFKISVGGTLIFHYSHTVSPKNRQINIIYLHQLQNLVLALTGKELQIDLEP